MPRKKKEVIQEEELQELDFTTEEQEDEENSRKAEILVGKKFKIVVTKRNYEIMEWTKFKTKDDNGAEIETEGFKNHYVYLGTLEHACKYLKNYMAKQKLHDKRTISSLSEAIQFIKDSNKETEKLFKGIQGI
jgi:hypothetical protein